MFANVGLQLARTLGPLEPHGMRRLVSAAEVPCFVA